MSQLIVLLTCMAVASVLSACAAPGSDGRPSAPGESSSSASPSGSPSPPMSSADPLPTITPPSGPPTEPGGVFKPLTVSGTVVQGIYDGCVELVTPDNLHYVLVGPQAQTLASGQRVTVRGLPAPQRESRCTGIVLQVRELLAPPQ